MSGTHRDLLIWSWSRCFVSKNHIWRLGPIQTSICDTNHAVVHVQNDRSCLGHIETCYSGPEVAVLHAKTTGGVLDPQRLVILVLKSPFCMDKTTVEGWNPYSLFILELSTLLCVLKPTDEVWDPYRLVSLVLKSQLCMHKKTQIRAGTYIDLSFWCKSRCFACTKRQVRVGTDRD